MDVYEQAERAIVNAMADGKSIANLLREKFPEAGWVKGPPIKDGRYFMLLKLKGSYAACQVRDGKMFAVCDATIPLTYLPGDIKYHCALPPNPPATVTVDAEYVRHAEWLAENCCLCGVDECAHRSYILAAKKGGVA